MKAALLAAHRNRQVVTMDELEYAKDKILLGTARRSMVMSEEEKRLTAYHESGHVVIALHCADSDRFTKRRLFLMVLLLAL